MVLRTSKILTNIFRTQGRGRQTKGPLLLARQRRRGAVWKLRCGSAQRELQRAWRHRHQEAVPASHRRMYFYVHCICVLSFVRELSISYAHVCRFGIH